MAPPPSPIPYTYEEDCPYIPPTKEKKAVLTKTAKEFIPFNIKSKILNKPVEHNLLKEDVKIIFV